tara:strand:+ start:255 stop:1118 length:864 start_codon:yes stop_codon:yes gene_type:complete
MSSKIKVDTIENVAGSGNVSLGSGHNLVVPGNITGQGTAAITGNTTVGGTLGITGETTLTGGAKVNTLKHTGGTTAVTLASTGVATIPKMAGIYEHIISKVSTSDGEHSTAGAIHFPSIFSSDYIHYKVVIGYYNVTASSNGHLYFRFLSGTNTILTSADYQFTLTRQRTTNDSYNAVSGANQTAGKIYQSLWNNLGGGIHGEINIYNVIAPVINGDNTDKGTYYRPIIFSDLVGYDEGHNAYTRQSGMVRYNASNADTHYTGFNLDYGQTERQHTHISVYGLRVHA